MQSVTYGPIQPAAGPGALGPSRMQGSPGTGVPGVRVRPVAAVFPPAAPGGPHPLPPLPACPVPGGFPNPFAIVAVVKDAPLPPPPGPGSVTITGPFGYLPGLGYFGLPGHPAAPPGIPWDAGPVPSYSQGGS